MVTKDRGGKACILFMQRIIGWPCGWIVRSRPEMLEIRMEPSSIAFGKPQAQVYMYGVEGADSRVTICRMHGEGKRPKAEAVPQG